MYENIDFAEKFRTANMQCQCAKSMGFQLFTELTTERQNLHSMIIKFRPVVQCISILLSTLINDVHVVVL